MFIFTHNFQLFIESLFCTPFNASITMKMASTLALLTGYCLITGFIMVPSAHANTVELKVGALLTAEDEQKEAVLNAVIADINSEASLQATAEQAVSLTPHLVARVGTFQTTIRWTLMLRLASCLRLAWWLLLVPLLAHPRCTCRQFAILSKFRLLRSSLTWYYAGQTWQLTYTHRTTCLQKPTLI